jgi:hypothetical protein
VRIGASVHSPEAAFNSGESMATAPAYEIERDDSDLVVRVNADFFTEDEVSRFLDYLTLESIRKRSQLTQKDADMLAKEIKTAAWERVRHLFPEQR